MYFDKSKQPKLTDELFKNPTCEYRGVPFWSWNKKLEKDQLAEQIETFKKMGFGGFNMQVRQGLEDEYLGKTYMDSVRFCSQKAKDEQMIAWLYDEDRWPSGVAGGFVTKNPEYRQKFIKMCFADKPDCADTKEQAKKTGKPYFLVAFSVQIDSDGKMVGYRKVDRNEICDGKRYFFLEQRQGGEPRYNYQSYVDNLDKKAVDTFKEITYQSLKNSVGDLFGKSLNAIFTDEPQVYGSLTAKSGFHKNDIGFSWTTDFDQTYKKAYGEDILDFLPELYYTTDDEHAFKTRFNYYTHVNDRFCQAYLDNLSSWCDENGINLTGHVIGEDALWETMLDNGDNMRCYKNMQIPGIDILCDDLVYNTPIQCRSVVRQYGKQAMMVELYGVTGWDFDFRGHKFQGDWLTCLGVDIRVPHLAWLSMKGEGKRDYPAPISYQSPWHLEYKYLEDYYARIHTALTRGKPQVKIGVIYPVDTFKMIYGAMSESKHIINEIDGNYKQTTEWLITNGYEFDFISESLLPDLCQNGGNPLNVGKMSYDVIIASDCMTLRPHTINVLNDFKKSGGNLIFMGRIPQYINAVKNAEQLDDLLQGATVIPRSQELLFNSIGKGYNVDIRLANGDKVTNLLTTMRIDGDDKWLFVAQAYKYQLPHSINRQDVVFTVDGSFKATLYNTLSGEISPMRYSTDGKTTKIYASLYDSDSLLVKLSPCSASEYLPPQDNKNWRAIKLDSKGEYSLLDPNVLLLDMAEYSIDDGEFFPTEEIMRIDNDVRTRLNLDLRRFKVVQPWAVPNAPEDHKVTLRYTINSLTNVANVCLALEHPHTCTITFNGNSVDNRAIGYYVDKDIKTIELGALKKGENILIISMPFGLRTDLESCYLLGDFGTKYVGDKTFVIDKPKTLNYGDITRQGFAFYGGNLDYVNYFTTDGGSVKITASNYRGAIIGVYLDDKFVGRIAFSPFTLTIDNVSKGKHKLTFRLFGTRYNTFSALHNLNADKKRIYIGPDYWRSQNEAWSYEYHTRPMGILSSPTIEIKE